MNRRGFFASLLAPIVGPLVASFLPKKPVSLLWTAHYYRKSALKALQSKFVFTSVANYSNQITVKDLVAPGSISFYRYPQSV